MKSTLILFLLCSVIPLALKSQSRIEADRDYTANKLIVKFKSPLNIQLDKKRNVLAGVRTDAASDPFQALCAKYGATNVHYIGSRRPNASNYMRLFVLDFNVPVDIEHAVADFSGLGLFEYVYPDYIARTQGGQLQHDRLESVTPNVSYFARQWNLHNDGTANNYATAGADIHATDAWKITTGDSGIIVAMLDVGVRLDHPAFKGRIWHNKGEIPGNGIDDDNNGYVDDVVGWNFSYDNNDPSDDAGHGTATAGIVAANGNDGGLLAGVDWKCKIMVLKVLDSTGTGSNSNVIEAMNYAVDNGARVLSMSLGSYADGGMTDAVQSVYDANGLVVAAAGNDNNSALNYPADCPHALSVGATGANDHRAAPFADGIVAGSNFGDQLGVVAPGDWVYALSYLDTTSPDGFWFGTSFATPHVSGLAALLLAQDSTRTPDALIDIIERTADDQVGLPSEDVPGWDQYYGYGRINAYRALMDASLGVTTESQRVQLQIVPNPASTHLSLHGLSGHTTIQVIDVIGTVRFRASLDQPNETIDIHALPDGMYELSISSPEAAYIPFIVKH